jgi:hypothetical protein
MASRIGWKFGDFDDDGSCGVRSSKKGWRKVGILLGYESINRYANVEESLFRRTGHLAFSSSSWNKRLTSLTILT